MRFALGQMCCMDDVEEVVEVVFAAVDHQQTVAVVLTAGMTIRAALAVAGLQSEFPEHNLSSYQKGIWGELKSDDHIVKAGDRVEIYRPLINDPKEARRKRAQKKD